MSASNHRLMPIAALIIIAAGSQLSPAPARADRHNMTYRARIDAVTTGSQATFVTNGGQTNTAEVVRSLPTAMPDPLVDDAPRSMAQQPQPTGPPQREQLEQQQQQRAGR